MKNEQTKRLTTVAIVEDDASLAQLLANTINDTGDIKCLGVFGTAEMAIEKLPVLKPDIVLLDLNLPKKSGVQTLLEVRPKIPKTSFIILTIHVEDDLVFSALQAGAVGYLTKKCNLDQVISAIREVQAGGSPISGFIARKVLSHFHQNQKKESIENANLSNRETEILELLVRGLLYKEIADQLGIGFETVRTHIRRIYGKLEVCSRSQAIAQYFQKPS